VSVGNCDNVIDGVKCKVSEDAARLKSELGAQIRDVPPSRHAWSDVIVCPNDGCERQFLIVNRGSEVPQ
jgi:hypothetical protein